MQRKKTADGNQLLIISSNARVTSRETESKRRNRGGLPPPAFPGPLVPFLFPPSVFPRIRAFSNEVDFPTRWPEYWSFSFSISPSHEEGLLETGFMQTCVWSTPHAHRGNSHGEPLKGRDSLTLGWSSEVSCGVSPLRGCWRAEVLGDRLQEAAMASAEIGNAGWWCFGLLLCDLEGANDLQASLSFSEQFLQSGCQVD